MPRSARACRVVACVSGGPPHGGPPYEEAVDPHSKAMIGYIDSAALMRCVTGVFDDAELAAAIQEHVDNGRAFGYILQAMKAFMLQRVEQCDAAVALSSVTA